jgi:hypothetical protein
MGSGRIAVPAELGEASGRLHAAASELGSILSALRSKVASLEYTWRGDAHTNYATYTLEWDNAANALFGGAPGPATPGSPSARGAFGILPMIGDIMATVWNNYVEVESTNTNGWKLN